MEIWKEIPFRPDYAVSNQGRVKRIKQSGRSKVGKILKPFRPDPKKDYLGVALYHNGKRCHHSIHSLVLIMFKGPRPKGYVGHHIDDDPTNNWDTNLEWCTHLKNVHHSLKNRTQRGETCKNKLTEESVKQINILLEEGKGPTEIGNLFNVHKCTISDIKRGRTWAWLTNREWV